MLVNGFFDFFKEHISNRLIHGNMVGISTQQSNIFFGRKRSGAPKRSVLDIRKSVFLGNQSSGFCLFLGILFRR